MSNTKLTKSIQSKLNTLPTTSSKIRYLNSKDYSRSEIATILNKRYQHIRNVLITPVTNPKT